MSDKLCRARKQQVKVDNSEITQIACKLHILLDSLARTFARRVPTGERHTLVRPA